MTYHYWISNRNLCILNVYNLISPGETVIKKRKIYKQGRIVKTNRSINMVENKVISEMNIEDVYNTISISDKCRLFYNTNITLLEMDGTNVEIALHIFECISNNKDEFIIFDIDDSLINNE